MKMAEKDTKTSNASTSEVRALVEKCKEHLTEQVQQIDALVY